MLLTWHYLNIILQSAKFNENQALVVLFTPLNYTSSTLLYFSLDVLVDLSRRLVYQSCRFVEIRLFYTCIAEILRVYS